LDKEICIAALKNGGSEEHVPREIITNNHNDKELLDVFFDYNLDLNKLKFTTLDPS